MLTKTMSQSAICSTGKKEEEIKGMQYQFPCSIPSLGFYTHSLEEIVHFESFWDSLRGKQNNGRGWHVAGGLARPGVEKQRLLGWR